MTPNSDQTDLRRRVAAWMKKHGLNKSNMANLMGISRTAWVNWEKGASLHPTNARRMERLIVGDQPKNLKVPFDFDELSPIVLRHVNCLPSMLFHAASACASIDRFDWLDMASASSAQNQLAASNTAPVTTWSDAMNGRRWVVTVKTPSAI